jgi:hypothetical protein
MHEVPWGWGCTDARLTVAPFVLDGLNGIGNRVQPRAMWCAARSTHGQRAGGRVSG